MRKLYSLAVLLFFAVMTNAQNPIPNYDFESWSTGSMSSATTTFTYTHPTGWEPLFSGIIWGFTNGSGPLSCYQSSDKYSGASAMQLTVNNDSIGADMMTTFPTSSRPLTLNGYYKFQGTPGDTFVVIAGLVQGDPLSWVFGDTSVTEIATITHYLTTTSGNSYQPFSIPFIYSSTTQFPDSALIWFSPLNPGSAKPGQQFWVDLLSFSGTSGIDEPIKQNQVTIFPNPVQDNFTLRINNSAIQNSSIEIYDLTGRQMFHSKIKSNMDSFNISDFDNGIYLLKLTVNSNILIKKFVKN